jgi:hypothetical protein
MKYDRFVYIVIRDGSVKAILTSASKGRKVLNQMRDDAMPALISEPLNKEYMRDCMTEHMKWRLEKWPLVKAMSTYLKKLKI